VALSDGGQGVFQDSGLDVPAVLRYVDEHGSLQGCPHGSPVTGPTLAPLPCDILVLSGFERIDEQAAAAMQAAMVVEGAYGTIAPEIDALLEARGIVVLPDILGGSGGAAASYFEWVQNIQETFWTEDEINSRIEEMLLRAFQDMYALHQRDGISLRLAAHCLAVARVAEAHRLRGLYP
jgi:glutamate dehydrogenase (NAD(P)+)